jgi:hypothetical protein
MKYGFLAGALVAALAVAASPVHAQRSQQQQQQQQQQQGATAKGGTSLGTVTLNRKLTADGQALAAGTYQVRLTDDRPSPAVGESPDAERYVEFVRGGKVVAKALATVVPNPASNGSRVDTLKGNEYVRVWINHSGQNYLIHMTPGA